MKHLNIKLSANALMWLQVAVLVFASIAPFVLSMQRVDAAQVESRSITMDSARADEETSYTISFVIPDPGVSQNVGSFRVEFCDNDPLPGLACAFDNVGDDIPQVDSSAGSITTLNGSPTFGNTNQAISLTAPGAGENVLDFTLAAQDDINGQSAADRTFTVTVDNIDNPDNTTNSSNNDTFYARLYVFTPITPTAYVQGSPPLGTDEGGVALSTSETLDITARVQEILEFCVGDTDGATTDDCADITGNDIDLGILDFSSVNTAAAEDSNAYAMIRTNALNGATISYFADAGRDVNDDGGGGVDSGNDVNDGFLSYDGADCTTPASTTDACINAVGATEAAISAGTEAFGMTISSIDTSNGATSNLAEDLEYDTPAQYTFVGDDLTADTIASSSTAIDDEMLVLDFGATASITTPSGLYNTSVVYIATSTF